MHRIGKYQLVAELARGGMGVVYLAVAHGAGRFQKLFVLKELKSELTATPEFVTMFLEEAQLAARLHHPNVVQTYDVDTEAGTPFLVMDYLDGRSLLQVNRRADPRFTLAARVRVMVEVLQALEYVHELTDLEGKPLRLVHRDVTPHNVFITFDGQVKLLDFGIAKTTVSTETEAGVIKGKLTYISPDQVQGRVDARSDLFAVGVMLWELAAGRRLWGQRPEAEIVGALLQDKIPPLREAAPELDPALVAIVDRALAGAADRRHESARAMRTELEAWLGRQPGAPSVRQIGELVAELFAVERADRQRQIEQALREQPDGHDSGSSLPRMLPDPHHEGTGGTPSHPHSLQTSTRAASSVDTTVPPAPVAPRPSRTPWVLGAAVVVLAALLVRQWSTSAAPVAASAPVVASSLPMVAATPALTTSVAVVAATPPVVAPTPPVAVSAPAASSAGVLPAPPGARSTAPYRYPRVVPGAATPAATTDCNPPFFFQGTKKVFKPGCL